MRMATAEVVSAPRSHSRLDRLRQTMTKHPELWGVLAAVIITLCTKYTQSQPSLVVSPQSHPRRFFASTSPVLDFPYGNIGAVADLLEEHQMLFVMYYAPWCAKSMRARHEFERAATYMQDEMMFVGINCWYDGGQCRQQNSFSAFPVLFAYHTTLDGFRYSGPLEADYIVAFLQRLLRPLKRLNSKDEIGTFLSQKDHVVVGFFDFHASPQPPGYDQFYYASMRIVEKDPINTIEFGVVTSRILAGGFNLKPAQRALLLTRPFNETLRYGEDLNFTSSAIIQWLQTAKASAQQSIKWLVPAGTKSLALSTEIQSGPTLFIFTPHSPVSSFNHFYAMVREVALAYHNCENTTRVHNIIDSSVYVRLASTMQHLAEMDKCRKLDSAIGGRGRSHSDGAAKRLPVSVLTCCSSVVVTSGVPTASNSCDVCTHYSPIHPLSSQRCPLITIPDLPWGELLVPISPCTEFRASYNPSEYISMCCHGGDMHRYQQHRHYHHPTTPHPSSLHYGAVQPNSAVIHKTFPDLYVKHVEERLQEQRCRELRLQRTFGWLPLVHTPGLSVDGGASRGVEGLTGLGCQTNRSITFLAMNSKHSVMFTDKMGIRLGSPLAPLDTAMVLIDEEREVQHVLDGELTRDRLVSWVHNITEGSVNRFLRSELPTQVMCDQAAGDVCLTELTTHTFYNIVMDSDKDVLVLYHAPWCGFCVGFAHIYLTLARYFKSSENIVFARINADSNDLPWELTVDSYPTLHFFPAHRKMDSVSFPDHLSKTLPNLLQFVLRYATSDLRLQTGLSICSRECIQNNMLRTARRLQELHAETHLLHRRASFVSKRLVSLHQLVGEHRVSKDASNVRSDMGNTDRGDPNDSPEETLPIDGTGIQKGSSGDEQLPLGGQQAQTDSVTAAVRASIPTLQDYLMGLRRRTRRKRLQLRSALDLHHALLTSHGVYIDKHKLTAILRTHHHLQVALREVDQAASGAATQSAGPKATSSAKPHRAPQQAPRDEL